MLKHPWHEVKIGEEKPEKVNIIIEIPKDSQVKYELDKETGLLKLDRVLYSAVHYPGDYGFVPRTLWDDGDPLDIIVLTGRPLYPMTIAKVRIIGILRMIDDDEKDDKLIGVYDSDPRFKEWNDIEDIPKHTIEELKHFFETYKELQGKECKILNILNKDIAHEDLRKAEEMYNEKFNVKEIYASPETN